MSRTSRDSRRELVEVAARLLAEQGPRALSARALARETGTSTMAVYTYFGGMPGLVRAVIREGFAQLAARLATVDPSDDPVADGFRLAIAYRRSAQLSPHLYAVMFGGSSIAGFELSEEDRGIGLYTLRVARDTVPRCIAAGRFRPAEPWSLARHMWCQLHGLVSLERAGYINADQPADGEFRQYLRDFAVGAGDTVERAQASVTSAFGAAPGP
ncbi:TetR/AcrR family transcriptional regulator [Micromonospora sp. WMMD1082]|uniref:TetR/AcrR family transcriptional regulator n=1 Tax=Micromonospora sp. WMMD1082 TaxID=3016104 RepID=UPI002416FFD0|nr:TetR/AcrR family transcriptional regulator [Micromonospora sp. WMMD1082]MDG4796073.1 TetR/AcrR family transcriptional regulator [Micromonospora sp. WMMD1082]